MAADLPDPMYRYPAQIDSIEAIPGYVLFSIFDRQNVRSVTPGQKIALYMPEQASMPNSVSWDDNVPSNPVVDGLASFTTGSGHNGVGQSSMNAAGYTAQKAAEGAAKVIAEKAGSNMDGATAEQLATKKIANPYLQMIFKAVNLREFQFQFKFYPHTVEDCKRIDNIIKAFRKASLPSGAAGGTGVLSYPGEIDIEYRWKDKENPFLHKFRKCVITSLDVNYTEANQWSVMNNGFPAETSLRLTFKELQIVLADDVDKGF